MPTVPLLSPIWSAPASEPIRITVRTPAAVDVPPPPFSVITIQEFAATTVLAILSVFADAVEPVLKLSGCPVWAAPV